MKSCCIQITNTVHLHHLLPSQATFALVQVSSDLEYNFMLDAYPTSTILSSHNKQLAVQLHAKLHQFLQ